MIPPRARFSSKLRATDNFLISGGEEFQNLKLYKIYIASVLPKGFRQDRQDSGWEQKTQNFQASGEKTF